MRVHSVDEVVRGAGQPGRARMRMWARVAFVLLLLVLLLGPAARSVQAQGTVAVPITMTHAFARFKVDGQGYQGGHVFNWPVGSTHIVEFVVHDAAGFQYTEFQNTRYRFVGWKENTSFLSPSGQRLITFIARPGLEIQGEVIPEFRVDFLFFGAPIDVGTPGADLTPANCGAPGPPSGPNVRPGVIYVDDSCYWNSVRFWMREGTHTLNVFPYPGFAFLGWVGAQNDPGAQFKSIDVTEPLKISILFTEAKRVSFRTDPPELSVNVDDTEVRPATDLLCHSSEYVAPLPPGAPAWMTPLCSGDFDFAPNSTHRIGARTPQTDKFGKLWVFDSFSNSLENPSLYTVGSVTSNNLSEVVIARFVRGVSATVNSSPNGLPLEVNGNVSAAHYLVLKPGDEIHVAAPLEAHHANGRAYTFRQWSNGGPAEQTVTMPEGTDLSYNLVAEYDVLSQVVIKSNASNAAVIVDGEICTTPCSINGTSGTEIQVEAFESLTINNDTQRFEFVSWADGADRVRTFTLDGEASQTITVQYKSSVRLITDSEPGNSAEFSLNPPPENGFYAEGTEVGIFAKGAPGHKFRRWSGDASGIEPAIVVKMSRALRVVAITDEIPYLSSSAVMNAATEAEGPVGAGSVVVVDGASLASETVAGSENPLQQQIDGVSVVVDGFIILPLKYISPKRIGAILPYDLPPGTHTISVRRVGFPDVSGEFTSVVAAPGLFQAPVQSTPYVLGFRPDGSQVTPDNLAAPGEEITVLGTGFGKYQIRPVEGFVLPSTPVYPLQEAVAVTLNGSEVEGASGAGHPGQVGVVDVKFKVPEDASGALPLKVRILDAESPEVILPVGVTAQPVEAPAEDAPAGQ